jgi:bacteriocin-like protein
MTKLKGAKLQDLAKTLALSQELSNTELSAIKGGCTSCQDIRNPPRTY